MQRQAEYIPDPGRDPLSVDAHKYTDAVPRLQQAAATNPVLNGSDAEKRLRGDD